MDGSQEQTELLRGIWNEMKALGENLGGRIDGLGGRIDGLGVRIDQVRTELKGEIITLRTELKGEISELRTELKGEIHETNERLGLVEGAVRDLAARELMTSRYLRNNVQRKLTNLDERVTRLETERQRR